MVEDKKKEGLKILFSAVETGEIKVVEKFLNKDFSPNTVDEETGQTLLIKAVINKQFSVVERLMKCEELDLDKKDRKGKTALDYLNKFIQDKSEKNNQETYIYFYPLFIRLKAKEYST